MKVFKRAFDLFFSLMLLVPLFPISIVIAALIKLTSPGPVIHWSRRVGKNNVIFHMPKFRTMHQGTEDVATHLMKDPQSKITNIGFLLRKYSLDEIPQIFSVIKGKMSFVGPRPALYNQEDLIALRTERKVDSLMPGITGWAQVNGRDELSIHKKVEYDLDYYLKKSFFFDLYIIWITIKKVFVKDGVSH